MRLAYAENPEKFRERSRNYRKNNSEKVRAYNQKYRENNREKARAQRKKWRAENPSKARSIRLKGEYGITLEEYQRRFEEQGGVCAICRKPPDKKPLAVDHCHKTGRVRGLLHVRCNSGLGMYDDNPEALRAAAAYLERAL